MLFCGLDVLVVSTDLTMNFIMLSAPLLLLPLSAFTFETLLGLTSIDFAGSALKLKMGKFRKLQDHPCLGLSFSVSIVAIFLTSC